MHREEKGAHVEDVESDKSSNNNKMVRIINNLELDNKLKNLQEFRLKKSGYEFNASSSRDFEQQ